MRLVRTAAGVVDKLERDFSLNLSFELLMNLCYTTTTTFFGLDVKDSTGNVQWTLSTMSALEVTGSYL